jgi:hypothetical protein
MKPAVADQLVAEKNAERDASQISEARCGTLRSLRKSICEYSINRPLEARWRAGLVENCRSLEAHWVLLPVP